MEQNQNTSLFGLGIDPVSKSHLSEAARWARFLAICGFILIGLMLIYGLVFSIFYSEVLSKRSPYERDYRANNMQNVFSVVMFLFYAVFAILAFFPYFFLLRFANKMKAALESDDQSELNNSFMNLKILYRYLGILTIIGLAFTVLGIFSIVFTAAALR